MSVFSNIYNLRHLMAATLLLPLLCACVADNDICEDITKPQIANSNQFINLSIVVSSGNESITRANPAGGEDGDGREAGYDWENNVEGVTFILYQINDGETINSQSIKDRFLSFFKYYEVDLESRKKPGTSYNPNTPSLKEEAVYTTGDQPLEGLDLAKKYGAIVVANLDLTGNSNIKTVGDVLDYEVDRVHDGSNIGANVTKIYMSLESEYLVDFAKANIKETPTSKGVNVTYSFDKILIERLAARVDFCTIGSDEYDNKHSGYVYPVYDIKNHKSDDKFVLTSITPFNCYNSNEFLLKRIGDSQALEVKYLEEEPQTYKGKNYYVLDPKTQYKKSDETSLSNIQTYMTYELDNVIGEEGDWKWENSPKMTMKDIIGKKWTNTFHPSADRKNDTIIVCYPKENTLLKESPLYYYATGLRIEGDYYNKEDDTSEHLVYYGFLRHEGEGYAPGDTYYPMWSEEYLKSYKEDPEKRAQLVNSFPMNFGVVRNNIYRISIDNIKKRGEEPPEITWKIKVKKWDKFTHDTIYM